MGGIIDLSKARTKAAPEKGKDTPIVHDTIITEGGGVFALQCPACDEVKIYMVAFEAGTVAGWAKCPHCQNSRARVKGEVLQVEKSRGILKP